MSFDPDLLVRHVFQHVAHLFEHLETLRLDDGLPGIEEHFVDHINGQPVAHPLDCNGSFIDFILNDLVRSA